jgi:hypothetical protein
MQLQHALRPHPKEKVMSYRIAGIDVHKRMLAVVMADVEVEGNYQFERRRTRNSSEGWRNG